MTHFFDCFATGELLLEAAATDISKLSCESDGDDSEWAEVEFCFIDEVDGITEQSTLALLILLNLCFRF